MGAALDRIAILSRHTEHTAAVNVKTTVRPEVDERQFTRSMNSNALQWHVLTPEK